MIRSMVLSLVAVYLAISPCAQASTLFDDDTALDVQLRGPIKTIFRKMKQDLEQPFVLTVDGTPHTVWVSVRGKSRKRVCKFPPLRLVFKEEVAQTSVFSGYEMLRLVTHCNKSTAAEQNAVKEFIAYRILNLVTPVSYRARLMRISYVDTSKPANEQKLVRYGFITEPEQDVARRMEGEIVRQDSVRRSSLNPEHAALVYIFQYLIGNTDWSLVTAEGDEFCCHNGQLIQRNAQLYYVPYDFDLAGLVDAHYAEPDRSLRIRRVTQRLYRGLCLPKSVLQTALRRLKEQRAEIIQLLEQVPGLSSREVEKQTGFLQRFFDEAVEEDELIDEFVAECH